MTAIRQMTKVDRERLKKLAAFAPIFRNPQAAFGKWHPSTGQGTKEDPLTMPWFEMSETAHQFITVANGFIETLKDFDWTKWIEQPEGQKLSRDRNAVAFPNSEQLAKLSLALGSSGPLRRRYIGKSLW
jgi:hypothetical protein